MLNNRIGRKIFLYTLGILLIVVGLFLIILFYVMPTFYGFYIDKQNEQIVNEIKTQMPTNSLLDAQIYLSNKQSLMNHLVIIHPDGLPNLSIIKYPYQYTSESVDQTNLANDINHNPDTFLKMNFITTNVTIDGKKYVIKFDANEYPIEKLYDTIIYLLPQLLILMFFVSTILGLAITQKLSKPLVLLNKKVKEISEFNFDSKISIDENTELGDISKALDSLSVNLKEGMDSLEQTANRAVENEKTRREFLAIMSHELKTPLTIIKGQNECMLNNRGVYKNRDKYLYENLQIINEMETLVKRILLSLKIDDENLEIINSECEVDKLVLKNTNYYEGLTSDKNLSYNYNITPTTINIDVSMLSYAIKNIIENAFFYADNNSTISIELNDKYFKIKNKNEKLTNEEIEDLFKPFKTLDNSRNKKLSGTGLGLYIIKRSIEVLELQYEMIKIDEEVVFTIYLDKNEKNLEI